MKRRSKRFTGKFAQSLVICATLLVWPMVMPAQTSGYLFNDSHFHLTNYVQEGTDIHDFLKIMDNKVGRVALFGIPLQQQWSLSKDEQARFDPMITGFNPTDMYAADHIRRVLRTFPGVFSGIGEFSIHKEFVSAKIADEVASLQDPALDRLIDFASEVGLLILIHNDVDVPFAKPNAEPAYAAQMKALFKRHPRATFIWAHIGVGRIIRPVKAPSIQAMAQTARDMNSKYQETSEAGLAQSVVLC